MMKEAMESRKHIRASSGGEKSKKIQEEGPHQEVKKGVLQNYSYGKERGGGVGYKSSLSC